LLSAVDSLDARRALASGDPTAARHLASRARAAAERVGSSEALCEALDAEGLAAIARGDVQHGVIALKRAETTAANAALPIAKIQALVDLGVIEEATDGELDSLRDARSLATQVGAASLRASAELGLCWGYLGMAELDLAADVLDYCLVSSRRHGLALLSEALTARCMLHALRDDVAALDEAAGQARAAGGTYATEVGVLGNGYAVLALVRGDEKGAVERLGAAVRGTPSPRSWSVSWMPGLLALLRAAGVDDRTGADLLHLAETERDPRVRAYREFARAVEVGRAGRGAEALTLFTRAERVMPPGWRRAHAQLVVARCAFSDGWGDPKQWMRDGLTFLDSAPVPAFAAASKSILRRAGLPVPRRGRGQATVPDALKRRGVTSREMDVLLLLGDRLSNAEIGAQLFLSARTVEGHVAGLLNKLGAQTRMELVDVGRRASRSR
jgi:DNA-binding CsgD family transcriptional regulator